MVIFVSIFTPVFDHVQPLESVILVDVLGNKCIWEEARTSLNETIGVVFWTKQGVIIYN